MKIALDWDGTIVTMDRAYDDLRTPPKFMPGAVAGLRSLKAAGHILLLYSARASRALREDPMLDPLIASGKVPFDRSQWERSRVIHVARYNEMLLVAGTALRGIFDAIDDGRQGKPSVDLFVDDRVPGGFPGWERVARLYGRGSGTVRVHGNREARQQVHGRPDDSSGVPQPLRFPEGREVHVRPASRGGGPSVPSAR